MRDGGGRAETIAQGTFSPPLRHNDLTVVFLPHLIQQDVKELDSIFFFH